MGDKAPKDTRKQAQQKQSKANTDKQKKDDAQAARQAVTPKNDPKK